MSEVSRHLQQIEASGLIRVATIEPDLEYLFRHGLVQDAAYESLLRQDRKRYHVSVAETLEALYPDRLEDLAPVLAHHYYMAEDTRALAYYLRAGDAAFCMYANREATAHYLRALEVAGWTGSHITSEQLINICLRCGRAYQFASRLDEAINFYDRMTALGLQRADRSLELTAQVEYTTILCTPNSQNDFAKGKTISEQMLVLARELGDRKAEARILWTLMLPGRFAGDPSTAISYGEQALSIARELDLRDLMAYILNDLAFCYVAVGEYDKMHAASREAGELWRAVGNLPMLADNLSGRITFHYLQGEYDQAIDASNEAFQISQSIDNLWGQSYSGLNVDLVYLDRGEFAKVFEHSNRTLTLGAKARFVGPELNTRATLALAYGCLGAVDQGLDHAYRAYRIAGRFVFSWASLCQATLAHLYIIGGDLERARFYVEEGYKELDTNSLGDLSPAVALIPFADAELALRRADYAHALEVIARLERFIATRGEYGTIPYLPQGLLLKGKALAGLNRLDAAREALHQARDRASALGARRHLWQIFYALSVVEARSGNTAEADTCRQQSRDLITYIADHVGQADLRESFLVLPAVREAMGNS